MLMDIKTYMQDIGRHAREASWAMARAPTAMKNQALLTIAERVEQRMSELLSANAEDMAEGKDLDAALRDRLELKEKTVLAMADGLRQIAALPDPIGEISGLQYRPSGSRWAGCGCHWVSSASSMNRALTSRQTPQGFA